MFQVQLVGADKFPAVVAECATEAEARAVAAEHQTWLVATSTWVYQVAEVK